MLKYSKFALLTEFDFENKLKENKKKAKRMRMTREIIERTIELRKKLHSMPEASMNETKTKKALMRFIGENTKLEITDKGKWFYVLKRAGKENAEAIAF